MFEKKKTNREEFITKKGKLAKGSNIMSEDKYIPPYSVVEKELMQYIKIDEELVKKAIENVKNMSDEELSKMDLEP